jgi:hypothetical protein
LVKFLLLRRFRRLANIALSALDRPYLADWQGMSRYTGRRQYLRSRGHATYRLVRYADDLVIMVKGTEAQAHALLKQLSGASRLSACSSRPQDHITHIGEKRRERATGRTDYLATIWRQMRLSAALRRTPRIRYGCTADKHDYITSRVRT